MRLSLQPTLPTPRPAGGNFRRLSDRQAGPLRFRGDETDQRGASEPDTIGFSCNATWNACRPKAIIRLNRILERLGLASSIANEIPWSKADFAGPIQPVDFSSLDGTPLKGYWIAAEHPAQTTVILGHGFLGDTRMLLPTAARLRQDGLNVFMFDYRAHGQSQGKVSTLGQYEGQDLAAAAYHVTENHPEASKKLFYMGHSMGAATVMLTPKSLAHHPEALRFLTRRLDGIILDSPFHKMSHTNFADIEKLSKMVPRNPILRKLHQLVFNRLPDILMDRKLNFLGAPMSSIRTGEIFASHPISQKPVLLMHGTHDLITPYSHALAIGKHMRHHAQFQLAPLPQEGHRNFNWRGLGDDTPYMVVNRGGERYFDHIVGFLKAHSDDPAST